MRNRILLFALAILMVAGFQTAHAGQGGPDSYGYTWIDSDEPGGPAYNWIEIRNATDAVRITGLGDDNSVGPFTLNGWDFRYYWTDITSWKFGSNGWVGLNGNIGNIAHCFPSIPQAGGNGDHFIAPFMTDLNFATSNASFPNPGEVWYRDNGVDSLIIEWYDVPWWTNGNPDWLGSNTFQMILTSTDSSITWNYMDVDQTNFNDTPGCATDLIAGFENLTGNIGLTVFNEIVPQDMYTVKIMFPATPLITVPDAQPDWNSNSDNKGQFFLKGDTIDLITNIKNVGNADITSTINIAGELRLGITSFFTDATSIPSLVAGADTTVIFPNQAILSQAGRFTYQVTTSNPDDLNPSNNENRVELDVVECVNDTLTYLYGIGPADGGISWTGGQGNEGGGTYIEPALYPTDILAVDVFILDADAAPGSDGFSIAIYDDTGVPGTILDSIVVASANVIESGWNRVQLTSPITITSGGFYIGWFQGGANVALGTETTLPISNRTFEILSGQWAPYRTGTVNDPLLGAHVSVTCPPIVIGINDGNATALSVNAVPNPANDRTKINYEIPAVGNASIAVMNVYGQTVFSTVKNDLAAGSHSMDLDTRDLAAGVYFINLTVGAEKVTRKLIVNR